MESDRVDAHADEMDFSCSNCDLLRTFEKSQLSHLTRAYVIDEKAQGFQMVLDRAQEHCKDLKKELESFRKSLQDMVQAR